MKDRLHGIIVAALVFFALGLISGLGSDDTGPFTKDVASEGWP